jgi:hypothetical protein
MRTEGSWERVQAYVPIRSAYTLLHLRHTTLVQLHLPACRISICARLTWIHLTYITKLLVAIWLAATVPNQNLIQDEIKMLFLVILATIYFRSFLYSHLLSKNLKCMIHETTDVSKRASQWYSKRYCVASVTKTFTLKHIQTIHRSTPIFETPFNHNFRK